MNSCVFEKKFLSEVNWNRCKPLHSGWLIKSPPFKKGKFYRIIGQKWHRRWFVLYRLNENDREDELDDGFRLDYYKREINVDSPTDESHKIRIKGRVYLPDLQEVTIIDPDESLSVHRGFRERNRPTKHIFSLSTEINEESLSTRPTSTNVSQITLNYRNDRTYYFAAENQAMVDVWVDKLILALNLLEEVNVEENHAGMQRNSFETMRASHYSSGVDEDHQTEIGTERNCSSKKLPEIPYKPVPVPHRPPPLPPKIKNVETRSSIESSHSDNGLDDPIYNKVYNDINDDPNHRPKLPPKPGPRSKDDEDKSNDPLYDRLPMKEVCKEHLISAVPSLDESNLNCDTKLKPSKELDCTNAQEESISLSREGSSAIALSQASSDGMRSFTESKRGMKSIRSFKRKTTKKGPSLQTQNQASVEEESN